MESKKFKHRNITLLVRSKLNSIQKIISKTLADSDINHDSQLGDNERVRSMKHCKKNRQNKRKSLKQKTNI